MSKEQQSHIEYRCYRWLVVWQGRRVSEHKTREQARTALRDLKAGRTPGKSESALKSS